MDGRILAAVAVIAALAMLLVLVLSDVAAQAVLAVIDWLSPHDGGQWL